MKINYIVSGGHDTMPYYIFDDDPWYYEVKKIAAGVIDSGLDETLEGAKITTETDGGVKLEYTEEVKFHHQMKGVLTLKFAFTAAEMLSDEEVYADWEHLYEVRLEGVA